MSYNSATNANFIAPRLLREVLHITIHPFDKESSMGHYNEEGIEIQGYVDLIWCFRTSRKVFEPTRFFVTAVYNPPFDLVLGQRDCKRAGIP
ncbi:hypothetical protein BU16DRAFT_531984 [Lophium mytilinum]|uniref:Uncharacterized protein n=1 Tax=Lophium mytilinum TaxID=390894 RepID=A0A6A6QA07_9PEZI|nr:hypothetical protein BU16DRAFT_531984 [Lophium mytilinum]